MPPEDVDQLDDDDRDDLDTEGLGEKGKAALERERQARKAAEREARDTKKRATELTERLQEERFGRLKAQHDWLEKGDLDGIDLDSWDARVARLAAIAGATQGDKPASTTEDKPTIPDAEKRAIERLAAGTGGKAPATGQTYTAEEIRQIGLKNQAEALRLIQEGLMRSP